MQEASARPLLELTTDGSAHPLRLDVSLVGREVELGELRDTLARSVRDEEPWLVTVVGKAGIGKSRLVRAFADELEGRCVAVGRCLEYGRGSRFWPLREIMLALAGEDSAKAIAALVATEPDGDAVGRRLASAVGFAVTHTRSRRSAGRRVGSSRPGPGAAARPRGRGHPPGPNQRSSTCSSRL